MKNGLSVWGLSVSAGESVLVRGVNLSIPAGKVVALIGESGSGKSLTAKAIMGLLPRSLRASGEVSLCGVSLNELPIRERTSHLSMIFQEPMTSLNPCFRIGYQITERVALNERLSTHERRSFGVNLLAQVGIDNPEWRYDQFPHELSGGMRQRAMIAMALASQPQVIIADEPTTALDVSVQWKIMTLFRKLIAEQNLSLLFITHDIALASQIADAVFVMYAGRIVEAGRLESVIYRPRHPYTASLLSCLPERMFSESFIPIPGVPPRTLNEIVGCSFAPRCPSAHPECFRQPPEWNGSEDDCFECLYPLAYGDVCR